VVDLHDHLYEATDLKVYVFVVNTQQLDKDRGQLLLYEECAERLSEEIDEVDEDLNNLLYELHELVAAVAVLSPHKAEHKKLGLN